MKVAMASEMREIDNQAIQFFGIPGVALMENAGSAVARKICDIIGTGPERQICIFAGKGNNGGDGFVVARHLLNQGKKVKVLLLGGRDGMAVYAGINLEVLLKMGAEVIEVTSERDWDKVRLAAAFADCLVDALLGTGFRGEVTGNLAEAVNIINRSQKPVVAVDIPSGVNADNGQVQGPAVQATHTVTFALPKPGLLFYPGAALAGEVTVAEIGIPAVLLESDKIKQNAITAAHVKSILPRREPWAHKGSCGRAAIVAGSPGMTGAAALAATSAVRAGAGLVTLGVPASLNNILEIKVTEAMTRPLPENDDQTLGLESVPVAAVMAENSDVLAIGPGLGRGEETAAAVRELVRHARCPMVIDADAINALAGYADVLLDSEALAVLTPHPGELSRLTGMTASAINADRLGVARQVAAKLGCILVLKGPATVVAFPDGEAFINTNGNAGMATGGTGDVLTGLIAALIAQGLTSHDAAVAGVYIHGLAGDIAARNGMIGIAAGDVAQSIPAALRVLQED